MKTLDDSNEDETQMIYYHFQKLEKAITSSTLASTAKVIDLLQDSASTRFQRQCGVEYTRALLLGANGIEVNNRKLRIDFAAFFKNTTDVSNFILLMDVFNEQCASQYIRAALCRTIHTSYTYRYSIPPESEINIHFTNGWENVEASFWIWGPLEIGLDFGFRFSLNNLKICNIETIGYCRINSIELS